VKGRGGSAAETLVGRDLARTRIVAPAHRRWLPALLLGGLLAGLALAALRVDGIRVRYGLAEAMRAEKALLEEQRALKVRIRAMRDPTRLAELAEQRGYVRPERVIELAPPATGGGRR
jgi:hypothetical protein